MDEEVKKTLKGAEAEQMGASSFDAAGATDAASPVSASANDMPPAATDAADDYNGMDGQLTESELQRDQRFMNQLTDNITEMNSTVSAGANIEAKLNQRAAENTGTGSNLDQSAAGSTVSKKPMSIEEAKSLLDEETRRLNQKMQKTERKNRKTFILVIIVALILCVAGVAFAIIMGNLHKNESSDNKPAQGDVIQQEPEPSEPEVVELSVNDELVQKLYQNFQKVGSAYSSTLDFYTDNGVKNGKPSRMMMLDIALASSGGHNEKCKGEHFIESVFEGNTQTFDVGFSGCYDGEKVRQKVQEIFGQPIDFIDGEMTGEYCGAWQYDSVNDEFFNPSMGCGGSCLYVITRGLNKAERDEDHIYLYETAYGGTCQSICHVNGDVIAESTFDEEGNLVNLVDAADYADQLDQFKWTFVKDADGNYIFEKLEKIGE